MPTINEDLHLAAIIANAGGYRAAVMQGLLPGTSCFSGYGEVIAANGANIDIWVGPTNPQPEPVTAGFALWVESSSTADNGVTTTGVLTVDIHYLDTDGIQQSTGDVILNGQTPVDTGVTDCMFVNTFHSTSVGSGLVAAGNIDCTNTSGGTVMSRILAAGNFSLSTMRMVPAGKQLIVEAWKDSAALDAGGKSASIRLRTTSDDDGNLFTGVYLFKDTDIVKDGNSPWTPVCVATVPALATIKASTWTTGAMNCTARWTGYLKDIPA